jgi:hypothetical protein
MPLANDPTLLFGTSGNALANTTLTHYPNAGSSVSFQLSANAALGCYLQVWSIQTGTISSNSSGTLVNVYSSPDNVWYDTNPFPISYNIINIPSTTIRQSFFLDTGQYNVVLLNIDPFNNINVMATTGLLV